MDYMKKTYGEAFKDLEVLYIPRPPKPDHDTLMLMKAGLSVANPPAKQEEAKKEEPPPPPAADLPAEPGPAIDAGSEQPPAEVAA